MGEVRAAHGGGAATRMYVTDGVAPGMPGVVLLHAWWGLVDDAVAYADRLAAAGFAVVAPDLYRGPTAATIEDAKRLSGAMDQAAAHAIAVAAVDTLAERLGRRGIGRSVLARRRVGASGRRARRLGASVVYYGSLSGPSLARASVPVLGHFAEEDPYGPMHRSMRSRRLRSAGREVAIHRYPGTGHCFAEPSRDAYRPVAARPRLRAHDRVPRASPPGLGRLVLASRRRPA